MPLTTIIEAIVTLLQGVSGIGKVLDYSRYTSSEKERIDTYVSNGVLNAWIVTRESSAAHDRGAGPLNVRDQHKVVIEGFRAVASGAESEKLHQDLVEAVRAELHQNRLLPAGAGWLSTPVQVEAINAVMFFGVVLCWHAKLSVIGEEVRMGG
jgi:hypothetical protein